MLRHLMTKQLYFLFSSFCVYIFLLPFFYHITLQFTVIYRATSFPLQSLFLFKFFSDEKATLFPLHSLFYSILILMFSSFFVFISYSIFISWKSNPPLSSVSGISNLRKTVLTRMKTRLLTEIFLVLWPYQKGSK